MESFWLAFWFFQPAGLANMAPVLFNKLPGYNRWNSPLDFGKYAGGKRILGDNKKWRGLVGGIVVSTIGGLTLYPQIFLFSGLKSALLGALIGFGALAGDAVESFFKRQNGKKPGETWFPFDQTDYIIGGILASLFIVRLEFTDYVWIFVIYFGLHLIISYIGWLLKLKKSPI